MVKFDENFRHKSQIIDIYIYIFFFASIAHNLKSKSLIRKGKKCSFKNPSFKIACKNFVLSV